MPKMKTHSSAKKRFKVTATGKIKFHHANTSHLMRNKSKRAKLKNRDTGTLQAGDEYRVKKMLILA